MQVKTKCFGLIELDEDKIITFEDGIMGFEEFKNYTILYDIESGERPVISWLQSIEEEGLAIPVINPVLIKEDYNPIIEDELLKLLGDLTDENLLILSTITVPTDVTQMSANLKAPFIINSDTRKACQVVVENSDYPVKFSIYEATRKLKEQKGEK